MFRYIFMCHVRHNKRYCEVFQLSFIATFFFQSLTLKNMFSTLQYTVYWKPRGFQCKTPCKHSQDQNLIYVTEARNLTHWTHNRVIYSLVLWKCVLIQLKSRGLYWCSLVYYLAKVRKKSSFTSFQLKKKIGFLYYQCLYWYNEKFMLPLMTIHGNSSQISVSCLDQDYQQVFFSPSTWHLLHSCRTSCTTYHHPSSWGAAKMCYYTSRWQRQLAEGGQPSSSKVNTLHSGSRLQEKINDKPLNRGNCGLKSWLICLLRYQASWEPQINRAQTASNSSSSVD